jgi:RNA polymerase sigma factor (sigma-70 family)
MSLRGPRAAMPTAATEAWRTRDEAVELLFRRHYSALLRLAYGLIGDRAQGDGVVRDAFASLYRNWSRLREQDPAAYLRSAVVRGSRSRMRALVRERSRDPLQLIDLDALYAEEGGLPRVQASEPAGALEDLPHRLREVVVCRRLLDLSVAQTAALLGVSQGSVTRRDRRAAVRSTGAWEELGKLA